MLDFLIIKLYLQEVLQFLCLRKRIIHVTFGEKGSLFITLVEA
ncbi:hypothetical protein NSE_0243 [Neorickettsia sennetsu str. Miyayama]|uniref:Uncharacterized protein n=1 Tax=Ehrlichia sennetsu (strain ATCC VR-367 / Miyayama) TaxID=222891 RepID=Q2GEF9_EHRS3|nr:hypothetical protein NSE_0243 [Neorickettsia sennetsu str. Miyayama]